MTDVEVMSTDYWKHEPVVADYASRTHLDAAEVALCQKIAGQLDRMRMLDIAVGGGRTTHHFAARVRSYVGVDQSPAMLEVCKRRFPKIDGQLHLCDARDLSRFADAAFDFILISYCGLDYMSWDDRSRVFVQLARVGEAGAQIALCSQNIHALDRLFSLRRQFNYRPGEWHLNSARRVGRWFMRRFFYNPLVSIKTMKANPYFGVYDAHGGKMMTEYYADPASQVRELGKHFDDVTVHSTVTGLQIKSASEFESVDDFTLYYFCRVRRSLGAEGT